MEKGTSETYKNLQRQLGLTRASFLDQRIGQILTKSRALAAISIATKTPLPYSIPQERTRETRTLGGPRGDLARSLFSGANRAISEEITPLQQLYAEI